MNLDPESDTELDDDTCIDTDETGRRHRKLTPTKLTPTKLTPTTTSSLRSSPD